MTVYGFLHTADVHVGVFDRLLAEISPPDRAVHMVDAALLTDARRHHGVDDDLRARISDHLLALAANGAAAVVCTCSTIGAAAEDLGALLDVPVTRVDRPMARAAVARGGRIAIVATIESTLGPTRALLEDTARAAGRSVELVESPCLEAWSHWEAGDLGGYFTRLASHLTALDGTVDVVVLAQASMAPVENLVHLRALLLSSPRRCVEDLVSR